MGRNRQTQRGNTEIGLVCDFHEAEPGGKVEPIKVPTPENEEKNFLSQLEGLRNQFLRTGKKEAASQLPQ